MEIRLKHLPDYHVAYLRHIGSYTNGGIGATWVKLGQWCREQGIDASCRNMIGISWSDPQTTPPEDCCYDASIEITSEERSTVSLPVQVMPGGLYVVARFEGTPAEIGPAWHHVFAEWLPQSVYQFDPRPCFELYPHEINSRPQPGVFICDICIPIRPMHQ